MRGLRTGDSIKFVSSANVPLLLNGLNLNSSGIIQEGAIQYRYTKTGDTLFTIERITAEDNQGRLQISLDATLSGDATDAQLGSRWRKLLNRGPESPSSDFSPDFSPQELEEIVAILSPHGANLVVTEDGTLSILNPEMHTCLVTSTVRNQAQGSMGGPYRVEGSSFEIRWRSANSNELTNYRFFRRTDLIPYVSGIRISSEIVEEGTWTIDLSASST